jgi:hypothetical protein
LLPGIALGDPSKTNLTPETIKSITLTQKAIINKIYLIRGQKVMIDRDLADGVAKKGNKIIDII